MMNMKYRRLIKSLNRYHNSIFMASRQLGKALDLNTPIITFDGKYKKIKDIHPGDYIIGSNGKPTQVIQESKIFTDKRCFKVNFDNDETITASEDHLWTISCNGLNYKDKVCNTLDLLKILSLPHIQKNGRPYININDPICFDKKELSIPPYILGLWLGDGCSWDGRISSSIYDAPIVIDKIKNLGYKVSEIRMKKESDIACYFTIYGLITQIRNINLYRNKHIPEIYLSGSVKQRLDLVRGLMDTDGYCDSDGHCEFYQKRKNIIDSFVMLLSSLGIKNRVRKKIIDNETYYIVSFSTRRFYVFNLPRKRERQKKIQKNPRTTRIYIKSIEEIDPIPCKCIMVDSKDKLFLAGTKMVPTHNSTIAACLIAHAAVFYPGLKCCIFNMD